MQKLPTLYKRTSTGAAQQWTMIVDGDKYWTEYGQVDGKIQSTKPTTASPKNVGRSNETTAEEQALSEAQSKWQKKVDKDYHEDIKDIDKFQFEPMLAKKVGKQGHKLEGDGVYVSPKLDGIRCYITKDGAFSRNHNQFVTTKFIEEDLKPFFEKYPNAILDGEVYNHEYKHDFNKITSLIRQEKNIDSETWEEVSEKLQYFIFDIPMIEGEDDLEISFVDRMYSPKLSVLKDCITSTHRLKILNQKFISNFTLDSEEVEEYKSARLAEGYEGIMIRDGNAPYEMKRSATLLKSKDFNDDEFEIADVSEGDGNRSGMMGRIHLVCEAGSFEANCRGNREFFRELLNEKEKFIGKMATVRFANLTPGGKPRHGCVIAIRDYE